MQLIGSNNFDNSSGHNIEHKIMGIFFYFRTIIYNDYNIVIYCELLV